jgi:ABC-2 type transport system permease protein
MSTLAGTGRLARFVVRRDRVRFVVWTAAIGGLVVVSAASLLSVYPDQASIDNYVAVFGNNPALVAFAGPGYGFDDPNIGVVLVNETQVFGCIATALMSIFLVNRLTRAEEESERAELVRSSVVGRHAPDAAAIAVIAGVNVVIGLVSAVGFVALDYPAAGSFALAASLTAVGLVFAGVTLVAAQVVSSGRATVGLASIALAVAFTVRAIGDIGGSGLSWASPIGWAQGVRAFACEQWWPLGLCILLAASLVAVAFHLSTRRDLGAGLRPPRLGRAEGRPWLVSPAGLAFVLQRWAVVGWALGLFLTGIVYGSIGRDIEDVIRDNPTMADILAQLQGASLTDSYFATAMGMLALASAGFGISAALRLRSEESAGRAEPILATPTSRAAWLSSHLLIAVAGIVLLMAAAGLGTGVAFAVVIEDGSVVGEMVAAALVTVPAILVLVGLAVALFGLAPGAAPAVWAVLAAVTVVALFSDLLGLPAWARRLSPLDHVPALPAEAFALTPLVVLTALAAALVAVGLWGFRRRDLRVE